MRVCLLLRRFLSSTSRLQRHRNQLLLEWVKMTGGAGRG